MEERQRREKERGAEVDKGKMETQFIGYMEEDRSAKRAQRSGGRRVQGWERRRTECVEEENTKEEKGGN